MRHCFKNQKAAKAGCSNLAENFWSVVTKFSHHKGLNQDHSDHHELSNKAASIRIGVGNVEKAHNQVSAKLGLPISSMARKHHALRQIEMNKKKSYHRSDRSKKKRLIAKITRLHKMGQVEWKRCHRSGKVPLQEDAKSNIGGGGGKTARKPPTCGICKQIGHTRRQCQMPHTLKQSVAEFIDYDDLSCINDCQMRQQKWTTKDFDLVPSEEWL